MCSSETLSEGDDRQPGLPCVYVGRDWVDGIKKKSLHFTEPTWLYQQPNILFISEALSEPYFK